MSRDPFAYEMALKVSTLEIARDFPAWRRVILRHLNEQLGRDFFSEPERERVRKLGFEAGVAVWEDSTAALLRQFEDGDRELLVDLPRLLAHFGEESRRITLQGYYLHTKEKLSLELCRIFDDAASEVYLQRVRGFIRGTIEDFERMAGTRDNLAFVAVGIAFDEMTALFVLPANFENGEVEPESLEAARAQFTALLHRIMVASGNAEEVERQA